MPTKTDTFAQRFVIRVLQSAANTLTYAKLGLTLGLGEKKAWIIHKLEWFLSITSYQEMTSNGDTLLAALCTSSRPTSILLQDESIIAAVQVHRNDAGTAASGNLVQMPIVTDYTSLPGGGLILSPSPLYLAYYTAGLTSAAVCELNGWYTEATLTDADYLQLIEMARIQQ